MGSSGGDVWGTTEVVDSTVMLTHSHRGEVLVSVQLICNTGTAFQGSMIL